MKKLVTFSILACCFVGSVHAESYKVNSLQKLSQLTEQVNYKQGAKLKKFISTLDPNATKLTAQQQAQYCQLERDRVNENYQIYDANRDLFNGNGATLTRADFIKKAQEEPISQALRRQGVACSYK